MSYTTIYGFGIFIVTVSIIGLVINIGALIRLFTRPSRSSPFIQLLKFLAISDSLVLIFCTLLYGIVDLSNNYIEDILPHMVPWLYPLGHTFVMTSTYATVLLSLERLIKFKFGVKSQFLNTLGLYKHVSLAFN